MTIEEERKLADRIVANMPNDEETLALKLGISREHLEALCQHLHKQGKIALDRSWDAPRHWKACDAA